MSILGLTYFLTAAEELNISRAAEKLYISQQTLSGHIQRLEEHYGVELFRRKPTLRLTPAGEAMLFYARQMLGAEHRMTAQFADIVSQCRGHLRLGMSRQRTQALFCGIWARFYTGKLQYLRLPQRRQYGGRRRERRCCFMPGRCWGQSTA